MVKVILSTKAKIFWKDQDPIILDVIGKGILLSNSEFWKKHRDLMVTNSFKSTEYSIRAQPLGIVI